MLLYIHKNKIAQTMKGTIEKMAEMKIKTNGYEISGKLQKVVDTWKSFLEEKLDVKVFSLFYYGDKLVFADCILNDKHYGHFCITEKQVHFNGHTCTTEQRDSFEKATWNDDCFNGMLFKKTKQH